MNEATFPFLQVCRGVTPSRTPIWIMRQAGRYLPSYRELRARASFLELCHDPDLAAEATLQPMAQFDLDAAILFSDLTIPLEAMGLGLRFDPAPVLERPLRGPAEVAAVGVPDPELETPWLAEAVRRTLHGLDGRAPLIGFTGAPFTLACYAVEGRGSRTWHQVKALAWQEPACWDSLMQKLTDTAVGFLEAQISAGCHAVQLFDSWAGILSRQDYARLAFPWACQVAERLRGRGVPLIYFAPDAAAFLDLYPDLPVDVVGLDWRVPLDRAAQVIGPHAVQGNLDPALLLAPEAELRARARQVLAEGQRTRGHLFNLGHGIMPEASPRQVAALIDEVHRWPTGTGGAR